MTKDKEPVPPRRIEPGDVVAVYCEELGAWTAALDARHGFIDTIERERLFDVLDHIISAAEARFGTEFPWARESLTEGTESVRDW